MAQPQYFRLADFSGGLNPNQHPILLKDNEAVDILNFSLAKPGSLISRHGYTPFTEGDLPASVVQLGSRRVPNNLSASQVLAHLADGTIVTVTPSAVSAAIASGFGTTKGKFVSAQDLVVYANGVRAPITYDGTDVRGMGIASPTAAPTSSFTGTGTLEPGTYSYIYTYYSSSLGAESGGSSATTITTASPGRVNVGYTSVANADVSHIRIYRRSPGSGVYIYLTQVANTTSTYQDDGSDTTNPSMGAAIPGETKIPPNFQHVAYYGGYYFGARGRDLYWSAPLTPHEWPALNVNELPFVGNDEVVALVAHQDALLVFGRQNLLLVTGVAGNWSFTRLDTELGAAGVDAVIEIGGQALFLSGEGLRTFPGMSPVAPNLSRQLVHMGPTLRSNAILSYVPNGEELWVTIAGRTYTVYLPTQAVSMYDFNPTATLPGGADGESAPLLTVPDGSEIVEHGRVSDDDGEKIKLVWRSKIFQLPNPEMTKFFRRIGGFASTGGDPVQIQLVIPDTGEVRTATLGHFTESGDILWDDFDWDVGVWPSDGLVYSVDPLDTNALRGHTLQLVITALSDNRVELAPPLTLLYREANRFLGT